MGTRSRAYARDEGHRALTPTMRWTLAAVGVMVASGLGAAGWLLSATLAPPTTPTPQVSAAPTPGPVANATPAAGSEVLPPDAGQAPTDRLPQLTPPVPLISPPLPASGFARNELVAGFPVEVVGLPPDTDVIDSSLAQDGTVMQATLTARTNAPADAVLTHYRVLWSGLGLAPGVSGGGDAGFSDAYSSVSLAFAGASGTGTVYTVYAVLRTE
ncbi:hypothetical protein [Microbacterium sp. zg-YB36]|uniref:hypothetical protein n=1 Tax=Microbacterium sp. zg-YB36 TaxID=2969407 RepID=UPI00214B9FEB|nr:hypothetical protein [Microbacterium sp. zg-YB36]MDL5352381.1 hypothetical protein [Microbacterium sp. zg-YB36]